MLSHSCISERLEIDRKEWYFRTDKQRPIIKVNILTSSSHATRPALQTRTRVGDWMLVNDSFIAQGGEKFMTIGNFLDDSNTTFSNIYPNNPFLAVYFFIDDVSVEDITVGIKEDQMDNSLVIFPTPASQYFTVKSSLKFTELNFNDVMGRIIYRKSYEIALDYENIDCSNWQKGIYFVKVSTGKEIVYKKILKN